MNAVVPLGESCVDKPELHKKTHFDDKTYEIVVTVIFKKSRFDLLILWKQKLVKNYTTRQLTSHK